MKKIILSILIMVCVLFTATGCDGLGDKYWEATSISAGELFATENFNKTLNIDFNSNINSISASSYGESYAELTMVFEPMFESAISYAYVYYADLMIVPKNETGAFKDEIKKINEKLVNFEEDLAEFLQKKQEYESYITFTDETKATSDIENARLLLFKRDYITIIESALELSENFFNARRYGYYDFLDYSNPDVELIDVNADAALAVNASNLEITRTAIKILRAYNAKEMASEYSNYWASAQSYYNNLVKSFANGSLTVVPNAKEQLNVWRGVYDLFVLETEQFNNVLENIDLDLLSKCNNSNEYAEETGNPEDAIYADYFINFYKNLSVLEKYTRYLFV